MSTHIKMRAELVRHAAELVLKEIHLERQSLIEAEVDRLMNRWFFRPKSREAARRKLDMREYETLYGLQESICRNLIKMAAASTDGVVTVSEHYFDAIAPALALEPQSRP